MWGTGWLEISRSDRFAIVSAQVIFHSERENSKHNARSKAPHKPNNGA